MGNKTGSRHRVIAALAVLRDGGDAASLLDYLSDDDRGIVELLVESYSREDDVPYAMERIIRQALISEQFSSLSEVHPAWILERLRDEPPRAIGIILRMLPSKHVRFILEKIDPILRDQIPSIVESFAVPTPILDVIRRRFERHFMPMPISRTVEQLGFEHLYYLKGEELGELIREIGFSELAIALSGISGRSLRTVCNRLELKDAKRLQQRVKEFAGAPPEFARQARYTILEVEGQRIGPHRMLFKIGLAALASAVGDGYEALVRQIQQKLDPDDAYLLKRFIDERRVRYCPRVATQRRELILDLVALLAEQGRVDQSWRRFRPTWETPPLAGQSALEGEDETETVPYEEVAEAVPQLA